MIKSPESLKTFLDLISQKPNMAAAARAIGASETLPYVWIKQAAEAEKIGDTSSVFYLEWPEGCGEKLFLNRLIQRARSVHKVQFESAFRTEQMPVDEGGGVLEPLIFNGEIQHVKMDPIKHRDLVQFCGHDKDDIWERDPKTGDRLIQYVRRPSPAHSKIHATRALLADQGYGDHRSVTISGAVQHGIITQPSRPRPAVLPAPAHPATGTQPEHTEGAPMDTRPEPANELDRMLKKLDEMPPSPLVDDMRRHVLERAAKGSARGPMPRVQVGKPSDEPADPNASQRAPQRPYISPEARAEKNGPGIVPSGGARISADDRSPQRLGGMRTLDAPRGSDGYPMREAGKQGPVYRQGPGPGPIKMV